MAMLKNH